MNTYSRIERRKWGQEEYKFVQNGFLDVLDNAIKEVYRITDEEFDYLAENMGDEEIELFMASRVASFEEKRKLLQMIKRHLIKMKND